ncbi:polyhomeotic-proximal chromatin protein-like isoform X2 [Ornithodoros turicata]
MVGIEDSYGGTPGTQSLSLSGAPRLSQQLFLTQALNAMEAASRKPPLAESVSPEPKRESRLTSIIDQLLISKTKNYLQQSNDTSKSNHQNHKDRSAPSPAHEQGHTTSRPCSPLSRSSGAAGESHDRLDSDVSDLRSSSVASGSEEENFDKPATTSNGVAGTTVSRRKRSTPSSAAAPSNGTALLTGDIKVERLSPESDAASPQSSPSPARVFPPGLGFVLGLRPGLVPPGHPFPPGVSAATLAAPALKQMEMMTRNYSDFMRSLAAKYNNPTGQDGFNFGPTNGAATGLLRGFEPPFPFKTAGTPPLPTASGRQSVGAASASGSEPEGPPTSVAPHHSTPPLKSLTSSPPAALAEPPRGNAPFNLADFSSSQTLLNLVRTASAQSASQLETYLRGAVKRPHEGDITRADPLDLSVGAAVKRPRSSGDSVRGEVIDVHGSPRKATSPWLLSLDGGRRSKSPKLRCGSVCSDQAVSVCGDSPVSKWSIDDVVHFVTSVESCAEYAEKFREQSIDGTTLPLLTEDHLTVYMGMRLGPALKLRTTLARMTGRCTVCMHCIHCHGEDNDRRSTTSSVHRSSTPAMPAACTPPNTGVPTPPTTSADSPASNK